jgi:hypothetical protein
MSVHWSWRQVSMYTTKSPIDNMQRFNVPQLKEFFAFSVKDRYQLNHFICIKNFNAQTFISLKLNLFSSFIYCCQHHERITICLDIFLLWFNWYLSFTEKAKNSLSWGTLKRCILSIGLFVVYIDTWRPVPNNKKYTFHQNHVIWQTKITNFWGNVFDIKFNFNQKVRITWYAFLF